MNPSFLSLEQQEALRRAMEYWAELWDFECPTLFGIELNELSQVIALWPRVPPNEQVTVALASLGALRELLYGASAMPKSQIPGTIGLSYEQAHDLCSEVHDLVKSVL